MHSPGIHSIIGGYVMDGKHSYHVFGTLEIKGGIISRRSLLFSSTSLSRSFSFLLYFELFGCIVSRTHWNSDHLLLFSS